MRGCLRHSDFGKASGTPSPPHTPWGPSQYRGGGTRGHGAHFKLGLGFLGFKRHIQYWGGKDLQYEKMPRIYHLMTNTRNNTQ